MALIGYAELELGENARITGCAASEKDDAEEGAIEYGAAIYMDIEDTYTVNYPGCFLYANGGRVEGSVYVGGNRHNQFATIKATNAIDHTDGKPTTVFTGDVYCEGDIRGGSFYGSVTAAIPYYLDWDEFKNFWSNISGGSFYGPVRTEGYVSGGTFYGGLALEKNAKLNGRPIQTTGKPGPTTNIPDPDGKPVTVTYKYPTLEYPALDETYAIQIVQMGDKAIRPTAPERSDLTFGDWYTSPSYDEEEKYDFDTAAKGDLTLYGSSVDIPYGIRITDKDGNAVYVTDKNAADVLGDGTVSYTPGYIEEGKDVDDFTAEDLNKMLRGETVEGIRLPKLTLNGAELKQLAVKNWGADSMTQQLNLFLQLELMGDNAIAYDETYLAEGTVDSKNVWALCITGNGTLNVTAPAENGWGLSGDWGIYR